MASKAHFFRGGLKLIADYQFNNNLIDDANGYNLTGTDITYNNGSAVFNGTTSVASRTDENDIFSFTNGVNDLPFRMELSVQINKFNNFNWIVSKRDGANSSIEWQLVFDGSNSLFTIQLYSNGNASNSIICDVYIVESSSFIYDIIIEYDGSSTKEGLNMSVSNSTSTQKIENGNYTGMLKTQSDLLLGKAAWDNRPNFRLDGKIDYLKIYK